MKIIIAGHKNIRMYFIILSMVFFVCVCGSGITLSRMLEVNATPITNRRIIIDAGHGLPDEGTASANGITEQGINLEIALKLQTLLETTGTEVILTRSDENGIYDVDAKSIRQKKISDTVSRVDIGNNSEADVFVSIHLNYYQDGKYSGWQTFYQSISPESCELASAIQTQLNSNFNTKNNRQPMAISGVYIMDKIKIPTVIVECGFLSNAEEEKLLQQASYQDSIAWGIYIGIQSYFAGDI